VYKLRWTKQADRDSEKVERSKCKDRVAEIHGVIEHEPYEPTPGHFFEKLKGYKNETFSRHIDYHHRFVYEVLPNPEGLKNEKGEPYKGIVRVLRMWAHIYKKN
jgi:Txe/YoeB family toxin of toxin-antitoxin system